MRKLTIGLLLATLAAVPDGARAQACARERPLTREEKATVDGWTASLVRLLPAAPAGWKIFETKPFSVAAGTVCDDPGQKQPFFANVTATYLPLDAPDFARKADEKERESRGARIQELTKEMQTAVQRGDTARMQEVSQEIVALSQAGTAPPPSGTSPRRAVVRLEVNFSSYELCGAARPVAIPGAAFASRWAGVNCMEGVPSDGLAAGFGDFRPRTNYQDRLSGYWAGFTVDMKTRPAAKVYTAFVEIHGDAGAVGALVKALDAAGLEALTAK